MIFSAENAAIAILAAAPEIHRFENFIYYKKYASEDPIKKIA